MKNEYKIIGFYKEKEFKKVPSLGLIPIDWEANRLGSFLLFKNGKRPSKILGIGKIPIYGANGIMGYTNEFLAESDYIIVIGRVGAPGQIHLAKGKVWISDNAIYTIRYNKEKIYLPYLYYLLTFMNLKKYAQKTTHSLIRISTLKNLLFTLPPIEEQWAIAEVLSTIDQAIESTEKLIQKLEKLKKGLMQELFTKGIGHKEFKETTIGKIPKEWRLTKLEKIANIVNGYTFPKNLQGRKDGKYPFIKVGDMNKSYKYINKANNYINDMDLKKLNARTFPKGTIIFPKIGMAMRLNKFKILASDALFDNNIAGIIPKNVDNEFLYYYFTAKINLISLAGTTTVPSIPISNLKKLIIPIPSYYEQKQIVKILSTIDKWIELKIMLKNKLYKIKNNLLNLLLTGKIRIIVTKVKGGDSLG